jgi:hypothetical protein
LFETHFGALPPSLNAAKAIPSFPQYIPCLITDEYFIYSPLCHPILPAMETNAIRNQKLICCILLRLLRSVSQPDLTAAETEHFTIDISFSTQPTLLKIRPLLQGILITHLQQRSLPIY